MIPSLPRLTVAASAVELARNSFPPRDIFASARDQTAENLCLRALYRCRAAMCSVFGSAGRLCPTTTT
jgi:hypothetical protein